MKAYKKTKILLALLAFIFIFKEEILTSYPKMFIVDNAKKNADAILILSGSITSRVEGAIEIYRQGYSKKLFITTVKNKSNKYSHIIKTRNQYIKEIIEYEGIPINYIPSIKGGVTSTIDEAIDMVAYLKKNPLKRIILFTDAFHTRRALYAFNKIFYKYNIKTKVEIKTIYDKSLLKDWYKFENSFINFLILEPIKSIVYFFMTENLEIVKNQ